MQASREINEIKKNLKQGQYSEAEKRAKNTIKTFPDAFISWEILGLVYLTTKKFRDAEKIFKKALQLAPKAPSVWYNLAQALYSSGNLNSAIVGYKKCIELKPDFLNAFL